MIQLMGRIVESYDYFKNFILEIKFKNIYIYYDNLKFYLFFKIIAILLCLFFEFIFFV